VEPDRHTTTTVWGHMCVWCCGVALGNINNRYCGLYGAYSEFAWLANNLDTLWADELVGLDDVAAWDFLDGLLYGYHGDIELHDDRTADDCLKDSFKWRRFDFLTNWGEQFDGFKSFLLCPPGGSARLLSRRFPYHVGRGISVSRRRVIDAATGFASWFEFESLRLGVPCQRVLKPCR
jgi:hypothetical protein